MREDLKKLRSSQSDSSIKSKRDFLAAEVVVAPVCAPFPAMLLENFPVEKQPLCLHAGRQSFYFSECMYADLCGLPRARRRKGQPKKARCLGLSHVRRRRSILPASRWGRCLTMRTVKRWHISMAINIRIKGWRDTSCTDTACVARDIDATHNNSSPSPWKHSLFRQIYRSLILCQCPRSVNKPDLVDTCALCLNSFSNSHSQEGGIVGSNRNCINKISLTMR